MKLNKSHWSDIRDYWDLDGLITWESDPEEEFEKFETWQNEFFPDFEGTIFSLEDFYRYIVDLGEVEPPDYDEEEQVMECAYE